MELPFFFAFDTPRRVPGGGVSALSPTTPHHHRHALLAGLFASGAGVVGCPVPETGLFVVCGGGSCLSFAL